MTSGWGVQSPLTEEAPGNPVQLIVAAPVAALGALHQAFAGDARFQVIATATTEDDLAAKLHLEPEALMLDATVFKDPETMAQVLAGFQGVVYTLLPDGVSIDAVEAVQSIPSVKQVVFYSQANFPLMAGQLYDAAIAIRKVAISSQGGNPAFAMFQRSAVRMAGFRAISVWNPKGGVGKSTVAIALAMEAANRNLPTLLVGLGGPDPNPLILGLKSEPNFNNWRMNPTPEGLKASIQKLDILDVLAGFPDPVSLQSYAAETGVNEPASLVGFMHAATLAGYAVVVLDVSAQELAPMAIAASNTLILVSSPNMDGVLGTIEGVRVVNDVLAGQHSIGQGAMHLVVNRYRNATYTPKEVLQMGMGMRQDFPPLLAAIPDDPAIEEAINARRPAYQYSEPLRQAVQRMGDALFAPVPTSSGERQQATGKKKRVINLGIIKLRI